MAISLKIKGGWEPLFDVKKVIKWWPKFEGEDWAFIDNSQV